MAKKVYKSKCCNAEVKTEGMPDFLGSKKTCTVSFACLKCKKGCDIKAKNKPKKLSKLPVQLPVWWSEEKREMTRLILKRNIASDFEYLRRELRLTSSAFCGKGISTKDLAEVINTLIQRGLLRALVCLTNQGRAYLLFYNPRRYRPA